MSEWISVTDRLPETDVSVLIYGGGDIHIGKMIPNNKIAPNGVIHMSSTDGGTLASHWMPLPAPPEVKDD